MHAAEGRLLAVFFARIRELFESQEPVNVKKTRAELMKDIDSIYYGFLDDDDERLIPLEVEAEKAAVSFCFSD